ncbi:MAG TPA: lipocalin family protein [Flavisolibacter sp.]|jgi:hypothetical protein|nr:lipocalin family protein [Flavisolibacter sp.]
MFKKLSVLALAFTLIMCKKSDSSTTTTPTVNPIVAKWTIVKETYVYNDGSPSYVYNYPTGSYIEFKQDNTYNYYNADQNAKPNSCSGTYTVTGTKINLKGCLLSVGDGDIVSQTSSALQISYQDNTEKAKLVFDLTK